MAFNKNYDFDNASNYNYDSDKITITGGKASLRLIDNEGLSFNETYTDDTGFTYDSSKTEISSGLSQIDNRPTNSIIGSLFDTKDANFGADGVSLIGTEYGTPTISGNQLDCVGANGLQYIDSAIGTAQNDWVTKFKYIPHYTTAPAQNTNIFCKHNGVDGTDDIIIFNSPSGNNLRVTSNGLSAIVFGTWEPTAEQEYTFEIFCVAGLVSIYVDDVQIGTGKQITPIISTACNYIILGAYSNTYNIANGAFKEFIFYTSTTQNVNYEVPEATYLSDKIIVPSQTYSDLGFLQSYDEATISDNNVYYTLNGHYFDGVSWVPSNEVDQYNDASTVITNIAQLHAEDTFQLTVYTENSNTLQSANSFDVGYTGQIYPVDNPPICVSDKTGLEELLSFVSTIVVSGNDSVTFRFCLNGNFMYFNEVDSEWQVSTDVLESSTYEVINANASTLVSVPSIMEVQIILHSEDGSSTPEISQIDFSYNFASEEDSVHLTLIYGFTRDADSTPNTKPFYVTLNEDADKYTEKTQVRNTKIKVTPRANGYWEVPLIDNEGMEEGSYYSFQWSDKTINLVVPMEDLVSYNDLLEYII